MKLLVVISVLLFSGVSAAQEQAAPIIQQFISDGERYGFGAEFYINKNLKGVYFMRPKRFRKRLTGATKDKVSWIGKTEEGIVILIDKKYRNDEGILKGIIYHELGHLFGMPHSALEGVIMSATTTTTWRVTEGEVARLFSNIKEIQPKYYMQ